MLHLCLFKCSTSAFTPFCQVPRIQAKEQDMQASKCYHSEHFFFFFFFFFFVFSKTGWGTPLEKQDRVPQILVLTGAVNVNIPAPSIDILTPKTWICSSRPHTHTRLGRGRGAGTMQSFSDVLALKSLRCLSWGLWKISPPSKHQCGIPALGLLQVCQNVGMAFS